MKLQAAINTLRELPDANLSDARTLLTRLDAPALRMVSHPRRRCFGARCPFTNARDYYSQGCKCEKNALALRLMALSRSNFGKGA